MNIVLLLYHSVEERDQVQLLSELGHDVFSIGAYEDPAHPGDDIRPPLLNAPDHPELRDACREHRERMTRDYGPPIIQGEDAADWAKAFLPGPVLDWADTIICHHKEAVCLIPQWRTIRDKRVIWRTVGQSVENNERRMAQLRDDGLQIIRYSPKEVHIPGYLGGDALIRFWRDPDEWTGWTGEDPVVVNVTQKLYQRDDSARGGGDWCNYQFWRDATEGLPTRPVGEGSEAIGGTGRLSYEDMKEQLRKGRVYLYTGTQPASYTLGLIEAMMTGIPVVSIGPEHMTAFPYGPLLFEGRDITFRGGSVVETRGILTRLLRYPDPNPPERQRAIELFGKDAIARQWANFLDAR